MSRFPQMPGRVFRPENVRLCGTVERCPNCSSNAKRIFTYLTGYGDPGGPKRKANHYVSESQFVLAKMMKLHRHTLMNQLMQLRDCGHVEVVQKGYEGFSSVYYLHFQAPENRPPRGQIALTLDPKDRPSQEPSGRKAHEREATVRGRVREVVDELAAHLTAPGVADWKARQEQARIRAAVKRQVEQLGALAVEGMVHERLTELADGADPAEVRAKLWAKAQSERPTDSEVRDPEYADDVENTE